MDSRPDVSRPATFWMFSFESMVCLVTPKTCAMATVDITGHGPALYWTAHRPSTAPFSSRCNFCIFAPLVLPKVLKRRSEPMCIPAYRLEAPASRLIFFYRPRRTRRSTPSMVFVCCHFARAGHGHAGVALRVKIYLGGHFPVKKYCNHFLAGFFGM